MARIEFQNVSKAFGAVHALRDVSFLCEDGDIVVVFGPPGSGKSTLLRTIAGLEPINRGEIRIGGRVQGNLPTHKRNVAMAFESYALYPHFKVRKNLDFTLRAPGVRMSEGERSTRIKAVSDLLAIAHLLDRYPHQLSGGQRQRVSLGRALIRTASATLLDEPLAHLDAQLRSTLRGDLRLFLKESKATTLYATPDFEEGFGIANHVIVLIDGVVHQIGTPEEVFDRPADAHVAGLVGDPAMNLIPLTTDGNLQLGGLLVPAFLHSGRHGASVAQVGFRPGAVILSDPVCSHGGEPVGQIALVERIGASTVLDVDIGGSTLAAKVDRPTSPFRVGDRVAIAFDWLQAHLFGSDARRLHAQVHTDLLQTAASS